MEYNTLMYKADMRTTEQRGALKNCRISRTRHQSSGETLLGEIAYIDDIAVQPGKKMKINKGRLDHILIPVIGNFNFTDSSITELEISTDNLVFVATDAASFTIENKYESDVIHFILVGIVNSDFPRTEVVPFQVDKINAPSFMRINADIAFSIGVYKGRAKGKYKPANNNSAMFAYVISGAFELEERLLNQHDGLAVWDKEEIEFEALSEFAILLIMETTFNRLIHRGSASG